MSESLKNKTVKGIGWSAIERFSVQGVTFLVQIVLARLLAPSDYGIIAILVVFLQIAQVFIDSGFGNALIKKNDCTNEDYSTVFWYNLIVASFIYLLFFFTAPLIASFYNDEVLILVLRVISVTLILNALSIIHRTILVKKIDFKSQSKVTLSSSILSGILGIVLAKSGAGVWALVFQQISNSLFQFIAFVIVTKWRPKLLWSKNSFIFVFNFGSKLLTASLISVLYKNLYAIVIGKYFSPKELGFFSRAESFAMFPSNNISNIISRVSFPIFSQIQENNEKLLIAYRKLIKYSSFIIFPLMFGLLSVAHPLIIILLTEKWKPCVVLLQLLCVDWSLDHICLLNLNLLYVKGRTDLILKLEIVKKTIAVVILVVSIPFGLIGMCWGRIFYSIIAVILNTYYTQKIFNFGIIKQIADFGPIMLSSALMALFVYTSITILNGPYIQLAMGVVIGFCTYFLISFIFYRSIMNDMLLFFNNTRK